MTALLPSLSRIKEKWFSLLIIYVAYVASALVGIYLYAELDIAPAIIWIPVGIALAAIIIEGYEVWPAIFLASLTAALFIEAPAFFLVGMVAANTLQPIVAKYILDQVQFDRGLGTVKDMFAILATALFVTMIVPTTVWGIAYAYNMLHETELPLLWGAWWVGSALSALAITPFLIRWIKRPWPVRTRAQIIEIVLTHAALLLVAVPLFMTPYTSVYGISLIYFLLAVLLWMAFRIGPRFMTFSLFLMAATSVLGALWGVHDSAPELFSQRLLNTQIFSLIVIFFFFIIVSIEEQRKTAVAKNAQRTAELEEALQRIHLEDQAKNEFLAMLAHELRNPLASILSSVELLRLKSGSAAEVRRLSDAMNMRVKTMARLLDDLLDISRITQKKLSIEKEPSDLHEILSHSIEIVEPIMQKYGHYLQVSLPEESATVDADATRLEQVFVNILSNAAKYTPPEGRVELSCTYEDTSARITIRDTGIGIPRIMLTRIFEPFVRIRQREEGVEGIGIGLSLAKSLIELHGGTIHAESKGYRRGSEFTIRLPLIETRRKPKNPLRAPGASRGARPLAPRSSFRILIIDDNHEAADALGKLFRMKGHVVSLAHDGASGIAAADEFDPDIIFLDIGLPDIDGYEVAQRLRAAGVNVHIVALTGFVQQGDKERSRESGFDHHLTKPVAFSDIEALLKDIEKEGSIKPLFDHA